MSEALDAYLDRRRARYSATTVTNESFVLRRFAAWYGRDVQVRHLRPERVEEWFYGADGLMSRHVTRDGRVREPVQAGTHNYYRGRLKVFFAFCTQRGWLRNDLLLGVQPMDRQVKERQQPAPHVLLAMLDHAVDPRDRCYLAVAMNTGLRTSEITRIRIADVDLDGGWLSVWIAKSKVEDRLPITSDLDPELRRWLTSYAVTLDRPLRAEDHLFPAGRASVYEWHTDAEGDRVRGRTSPSWRPEKPMTHAERVVQHCLAAVGLPTLHEGTHTIRRAVARHLFDALCADPLLGYDGALRTVSALLHHKNCHTTEIYLGLSAERQRRDLAMHGKPFLSRLVDRDNVIELRDVRLK